MYSIKDLSNDRLNIVCRINNEMEFYKLRSVCPNMYDFYSEGSDHYLTSRAGRGVRRSYEKGKDIHGVPYRIIDICDIDGIGPITEFGNGVPLLWEDEV